MTVAGLGIVGLNKISTFSNCATMLKYIQKKSLVVDLMQDVYVVAEMRPFLKLGSKGQELG